ncbi:MAG: cell wall biogenesis protein [Candidatus Marinimicrobia bacterium]|jgi:dTDP-4-amino-4,6-dideoxygalactose transaminase|nr:cell wall biogenesis protein [Candidatus Neomarinimicrobiota bacterium]|tara:strand:+ start:3916 stop:5031 length:1116 start_codon:yes stop_codon:yes gene_type:complete
MTDERNVPFFDYPRLYEDDKEELLKIFDDVGSRGAFIMQSDLEEFEKSLAKYTGSNHAIGVGNATDGLEFCWMALGLKPGDEVICSSHTMLATASSIITAGGRPIPVEIKEDDCLIDPEAIEDAIGPNTVGIMPTQLNGRVCDMDSIMKIAEKNNLLVVEDAAQSLGAHYKGQHSGTFGSASAISFFPAKVMGTLGDAGGVITNDANLFDKIYQLHDHGRNYAGEVKSWGRNSRLDNLHAAILNYKLPEYGKIIKRRREIASLYDSLLNEVEELKLPPPPTDHGDNFDIFQNYELRAQRRDGLKEFLNQNNIGTLIQWGGKGVHQWKYLGFEEKLPKVEKFFEECIMLPMNVFISDEDVHYVAKKVIEFYR